MIVLLYRVRCADPKKAPFLPRDLVGPVSRFAFHALLLPLIYSTIAMTVTIESIGDYWFVVVGAFVVLGVSYVVATLMQYIIPISNAQDFRALRISVTFPNIVSLPILFFPSLCEFPVVHEGYVVTSDEDELDRNGLEEKCITQANTMIFCYFFSFMFLFWGLGYPQLMNAAQSRSAGNGNNAEQTEQSQEDESRSSFRADLAENGIEQSGQELRGRQDNETSPDYEGDVEENESNTVIRNICNALKQTLTSPGFVATIIGFITACITPLQHALFEPEEPLRFLGSALETLGSASSSISTMIVAASLVPQKKAENDRPGENTDSQTGEAGETPVDVDQNALTDPRPTSPNRSSRIRSIGASIRTSSTRIAKAVTRSTPEMRRLHLWFCLSRLVVSPAVVVGIIVALDCGSNVLEPVPKLALLVLIINSCLPGASIVVVLLKSKMVLEDTATVVAKAYFLSYIVCIFTIAAWTALGLWITLPDEDGNTVCRR
eukprot:scaffold16625_cov118-Cylindrotheca_fusiformis.AAC.6